MAVTLISEGRTCQTVTEWVGSLFIKNLSTVGIYLLSDRTCGAEVWRSTFQFLCLVGSIKICVLFGFHIDVQSTLVNKLGCSCCIQETPDSLILQGILAVWSYPWWRQLHESRLFIYLSIRCPRKGCLKSQPCPPYAFGVSTVGPTELDS